MTASTDTVPEAPRKAAYQRQAKWKERNQLKVWAHQALRGALKRGLITKQPCEVCGAEETEAHHPDHLRALEVLWLCRKHHKALHAQENAGPQEDAA